MDKPHILQVGPYPEWDQGPLDMAYTVHKLFAAENASDMLANVGPFVRAVATRGGLGANAELIDLCPNLEIVAVYGVGYDSVDIDVCRARNIRVTNTPDVLTDDVADLGIAMMLAQSRRIVSAEQWVRKETGLKRVGSRSHGAFPAHELASSV